MPGLNDDLFARYGVTTTGRGAWGRGGTTARESRRPALAEAQPAETRSEATRPVGVAGRHLAEATRAGEGLGEPSSWKGGAGAPEPIAVMRGATTTYSPGRLPGDQFAEPEFATAQQSQQAWNRAMAGRSIAEIGRTEGQYGGRPLTVPRETMEAGFAERYGEYREPGQTKAEILALREGPGARQEREAKGFLIEEQKKALLAKTDKEERDQAATGFEGRALRRWGTYDKAGKAARPTDQYILRDLDEAKEYAREMKDSKAGEQYMEWSHALRQMYPDKYAMAMRENPLLWREFVITGGPRLGEPGGQPAPAITQQPFKLGVSPLWGKVIPPQTEETPPPF